MHIEKVPSGIALLFIATGLAVALVACSGVGTPAVTSSAIGSVSAAASPKARPSFGAPSGQILFVDQPLVGHSQIYLEKADGSDVRRLVTSESDDRNPALSPDGGTVLFWRQHDPGPDRIFAVNPDGSGLHQVIPSGCPADATCSDSSDGHPWSPDGTLVAFTRAILYGGEAVPSNVGIWVMKADGSGAHQVTLTGIHCENSCPGGAQDNYPGWSPDGRRLVFRRWTYSAPDRFEIFTVAPDGSNLRQVTPSGLLSGDPAWSPDGTLIVFQSPEDPGAGIVQKILTIHPCLPSATVASTPITRHGHPTARRLSFHTPPDPGQTAGRTCSS